MHKFLFVLSGASILALAAPSVFERYKDRLVASEVETIETAPIVEAALPAEPMVTPSHAGRTARLEADESGHFRAEARLNGRTVPVLVDTGATYVSIDEDTARKLGIRLHPDDFKFTARTANGERSVAIASIGRIQIGRVTVENVEAMITKGEGLPIALLGMSFLGKLKRFEIASGTLNLVE